MSERDFHTRYALSSVYVDGYDIYEWNILYVISCSFSTRIEEFFLLLQTILSRLYEYNGVINP